MKTEKLEEVSFTPKAEKLALLKEYAKKNGIVFYSVVHIPESTVDNFEKFLKENDVFDTDFEKFLEDLSMIDIPELEEKHDRK